MPFRLKLRRTRRYNVLSKNYFVTRIRLLDGNVIECTLSVESTGQECLEAVAQRLELREVRISHDCATPKLRQHVVKVYHIYLHMVQENLLPAITGMLSCPLSACLRAVVFAFPHCCAHKSEVYDRL